ncbi:MAG: MFS transporter [Limnohabitans sp.]|nr:MFS transporter [Limnohabitans sp.]
MKKIFYGWKMVAAAAGIQFIQAMMLHQAFGAYLAVMIEEKGWSKTSVSGASALQSMEAAIIGPILGWFIDRFGSQGLIKIGIVLFGIGFICLSQIDTLGGLYGAVVVIAIGSSMCGYFPLNCAIIQWFEKKRARAISMVGLGLAVGGIFVPVVAWGMQQFGWRTTALSCGILAILVGYPVAMIFRRRPEDHGEVVDGHDAATSTSADEVKLDDDPGHEFTAREALRTSSFWLVSAGHGLALLVVSAVNTHAINHMRISLAYTVAQASFFITLMTLAQVAGVLTGSVIGDRVNKTRVSALCMLMHAAGLLMLTYANDSLWLVGFALLHGFAWGLRGPFMQAIRADYFGRRSIGMILGLSAVIAAIGQVMGPMLAGVLGDITGDYLLGFTVLALLAGTGSVSFWMARRPLPPTQSA